eukprot:PhM_4_TR1522/c0_g1_i1/m.50012
MITHPPPSSTATSSSPLVMSSKRRYSSATSAVMLTQLMFASFLVMFLQQPSNALAAYEKGWAPQSCLARKYRPSNVSVDSNGFHICTSTHCDDFVLKGVGYSPIPPSKYTFSESFDFFTDEFEYMWKRDLPLISKMGVNTLRIWSWDSFRDHTKFLDACIDHNLYVLVPFMFNHDDYEFLTDGATRGQLFMDWKAFVLSQMHHPAVLGFLIGNELNEWYADQKEALFSAVNVMVQIRNDNDPARHPITLPLSDKNFIEDYVSQYYDWSNIDFWSLQIYRSDISDVASSFLQAYKNNTDAPMRPLVLTEFGVDALEVPNPKGFWPSNGSTPQMPKEDEDKQATKLCTMYSSASSSKKAGVVNGKTYTVSDIVKGTFVMEWNDEWWKGSFSDVRSPMCPNMRSDIHTYCSENINKVGTADYIHEEWLGLTSQKYDSTRRKYCISPRAAYNAMQLAYTGKDCTKWKTINVPDEVCANVNSVWLQPLIVMVLPIFLILVTNVAIGAYLRRRAGYPLRGPIPEPSAEEIARSCQEDRTPLTEETLDSAMGQQLCKEIGEAYLYYCDVGTAKSATECPYFIVPQERIRHMIWDKYLSYRDSTEEALYTATRVVYEQYMEGYYLWNGDLPPKLSLKAMIKDLALYTIIAQWAGTIQHAPEKMFEVFDYCKIFFDSAIASQRGSNRASHVKDFHHGLVEIFRVYYLKIDQENYTFEDVNSDAVFFRKMRLKNTKKKESGSSQYRTDAFGNVYCGISDGGSDGGYTSDGQSSSCVTPRSDGGQSRDFSTSASMADASNMYSGAPVEAELLPYPKLLENSQREAKQHPYLEYHQIRSSEEVVMSTSATFFFKQREKVVGKWFPDKFSFKQRGGPMTMMLNYSWVVRLIVWQGVFAWYLQPAFVSRPMCLCEAFMWLASLDSWWNFFVFLFHYRVLGRLKRRTWLEMIWAITSVVLVTFTLMFRLPGMETNGLYTSFVGKVLDGTSSFHELKAGGIDIDVFSSYILLSGLWALAEEVRLFLRDDTPYPIRGRFLRPKVLFRVRLGFVVTVLVYFSAMIMLLFRIDSVNKVFEDSIWPNFGYTLWLLLTLVGGSSLSWGAARLAGKLSPDSTGRANEVAKVEANYLVMNLIFWGLFFSGSFLLAYYILVPSVENIQFSICDCDSAASPLNTSQLNECRTPIKFMCYLAVAFSWIAAYMVAFVALYALFEIQKLIFGLARGKYVGVGNVQNWGDVERHFDTIRKKCMPMVSQALTNPLKQERLWNHFIDAMFEEHLLNKREHKELTIDSTKSRPNFGMKLRSAEAERRIIHFMWTLESMLRHYEVGSHNLFRRRHRVRTMPTWTVTVPIYNEPVYLSEDQLRRHRTLKKSTQRISEIEYLVHTLPEEWDNLAERVKDMDASWVVAEDNYPMDLLSAFLEMPGYVRLSEDVLLEIRLWASMRGQTLMRTIAGLVNCHKSLVQLAMLEDNISEEEATRLASRKYQIMIAHQTYNGAKNVEREDGDAEHWMEMAFRQFKHFDLVYNNDKLFQSKLKRLREDIRCRPSEPLRFARNATFEGDKQRKVFNYFPADFYEYRTVQRVGRLKIGEGKAENQMHAVPFATGVVFQAIDMNQYATVENGYKIPYCLSDYFNNPHDVHATSNNWDHHSLIPPVRILGFPEHTYTRVLSTVGEMMGAAEWCFVTISQRTLVWPLRIRAHYGHPDFFDGFWVRNRGGGSKASLVVNTNEDIFAGYEMIGRGEKGGYVEFFEYQKGRESSFAYAFVFEAKLAQGGAQQIRSFDVYRLNRKLDVFQRFALFFSSLAFYATNLIMAITVNYYILAIALFALSGVSYHKLGLLDAVIAVPWLFQIGYVMALPMIVELIIQRGFWSGILQFFRTLIPSIFFFVFHLRTKTYYFTQGLLVGKGGYMATGRGFGLDRNTLVDIYTQYSESHLHEALLIVICLIVYGVYGEDTFGSYLLRTFTIIIITISWLWAPVFFNPAPSVQELQNDVKELMSWLSAKFRHLTPFEAEGLSRKLEGAQHKRLLNLISSFEAECRATGSEPSPGAGNHADDPKETDKRKSSKSVMRRSAATFGSRAEARKAVEDVHKELVDAEKLVQSTLTTFESPNYKVDEKVTSASLQNEFWGTDDKKAWMAWWHKAVLLRQWEGEDEFFPGLTNLAIQKTYLVVELFFPWIVVAVNNFYEDSIYFLMVAAGIIVLSYVVNHWLAVFHEHNQMMKASTLLCFPFAIGYFKKSYMSTSELIWSMTLYYLVMSLATRGIYGVMNMALKYRVVGLSGNPYRVDFTPIVTNVSENPADGNYAQQLTVGIQNRIHEMEALNDGEKRRLTLFLARMQFPRFLAGFRRIQPLLCMALVTIGYALSVSIAGWLTTLLYNGRVSEAWKKALNRIVVPDNKDPPPPPPVADDRTQREAERMHVIPGSISASIPYAERPKANRVTRRLHAGPSKQRRERKTAGATSDIDRSTDAPHTDAPASEDNSVTGSLPRFSSSGFGGLLGTQAGTRVSTSSSVEIPLAGDEGGGDHSKSPISFLDAFTKKQ